VGVGVLVAALLVAAGLFLRRGPAYLLRYRFSPGTRLTYEVTLAGAGKAALASPPDSPKKERVDLPVEMTGEIAFSLDVKEVSSEGVAVVALTIAEVDATIRNEVRGRKMRMELNREGMKSWEVERLMKEIPAAAADFPLKGILDSPFRMRIDPRGKVIDCDLPAELKSAFPLPNLRELLVGGLPDFPEGAVRPGESWPGDVTLPMPAVGKPWSHGESWKIQLRTVLEDVVREGDGPQGMLAYSGRVEQQWGGPEEDKRKQSGIKSFTQTMSGKYRFDLERGWLLGSRSTLKQAFQIFMNIDKVIAGKGFDVEVDFTLNVETKLVGIIRKN
jgi:hypothetical protein